MAQAQRERGAKKVADLIQEAVDKGATTVEEVHRSIADLPLKMLDNIALLKKPVKEIRRVQDRSIGAVYNLIRDVNGQVGSLASGFLNRRAPNAAKQKPAAPARKSRSK